MRMRFLLSLAAILLWTGYSSDAGNDIVVLSCKGKVEYLRGGKGRPQSVTVGLILGPNDVIRSSFASYVKIMYKQRYLLSVDENSTIRVSALIRRVTGSGTQEDSPTGKIMGYLADKLKKSRTEDQENVYGAVRGNEGEMFNAVFPRKGFVLSAYPVFEWISPGPASRYTFTLVDEELRIVYETILDSTRLTYSDALPLLQEGRKYLWRVIRESDGAESDIVSFTVMRHDTMEAVKAELSQLDRELKNMTADDIMFHIIHATYYEQRELFQDAFEEYRRAVALSPEVKEYRGLANALLFRLGLYNEHKALLP